MPEEGSLPRLHSKGKFFVENHHQAVPLHELQPVRETGLSEKASLRDNLIVHSENTSIHENLLICRRRPKDDRLATEFVSLREIPASAEEAAKMADAISVGRAEIRRAQKLTYPKWSKEHLKSLPCPRPETPSSRALTEAWERAKRTPLLPFAQAEGCVARQIIDKAAALAIGTEGSVVADWRRRLAAEPTITNVRAPDSAKELG